jgi:hypothetical protein
VSLPHYSVCLSYSHVTIIDVSVSSWNSSKDIIQKYTKRCSVSKNVLSKAQTLNIERKAEAYT